MDGRDHPAPEDYDATYFGHSVGHWEDDTLVIDTVHFVIMKITALSFMYIAKKWLARDELATEALLRVD